MRTMRSAKITRKTAETDIELELRLDGRGDFAFTSGIGFFDHMLSAFARHGGFSIAGCCVGDLYVDTHHTIEDTGVVLGKALREALDSGEVFARFGMAYVPMDEALARAVADISSRPYLIYDLSKVSNTDMDIQIYEEFFRAFAFNAGITLHIEAEYGRNGHHITEAIFKAAARALGEAARETGGNVLSTKGVL